VSSDLEPVGETIDGVFTRLGVANPKVMAELSRSWDEIAGSPWAGRSKPVVVRGKVLVVEASQPSVVAFLKYGVSSLLETLAGRFGEGVVTGVEVMAPGHR
jgi:predicted nucleic acid-binding Zn ribbon protein